MKPFLLLLLTTVGFAQTINLTGPVTVKAGNTFNLVVRLSGSNITAAQWKVRLPDEYQSTVSTNTGKTLVCTLDKTSCVLYGLNRNIIASGPIATYILRAPIEARGHVYIPLVEALGSNSLGNEVVPNLGYAVTVVNP